MPSRVVTGTGVDRDRPAGAEAERPKRSPVASSILERPAVEVDCVAAGVLDDYVILIQARVRPVVGPGRVVLHLRDLDRGRRGHGGRRQRDSQRRKQCDGE